MKNIKFRAYNPRDKKMHYDITGFEFFGDGNMSGVFIDGAFYLIEEIKLMQYTGLHDENGKEIYEGDIIQYEDITKGLVRYSEKYAQYVLVDTGSVKDEFEPLGDYNMGVFEIIGNEFDNPDLLEKGAEE